MSSSIRPPNARATQALSKAWPYARSAGLNDGQRRAIERQLAQGGAPDVVMLLPDARNVPQPTTLFRVLMSQDRGQEAHWLSVFTRAGVMPSAHVGLLEDLARHRRHAALQAVLPLGFTADLSRPHDKEQNLAWLLVRQCAEPCAPDAWAAWQAWSSAPECTPLARASLAYNQTLAHAFARPEVLARTPVASLEVVRAWVQDLAARGVALDAPDREGMTPVMLVVQVRPFLEAGARVDAMDEAGNTALHYAARSGRLDDVAALLAYGASPNALNNAHETPLHWVFDNEDPEERVSRNGYGDPPKVHVGSLKALLSHGADLDITHPSKSSPRWWLEQLPHGAKYVHEVAQFLAERAAQALTQDLGGPPATRRSSGRPRL